MRARKLLCNLVRFLVSKFWCFNHQIFYRAIWVLHIFEGISPVSDETKPVQMFTITAKHRPRRECVWPRMPQTILPHSGTHPGEAMSSPLTPPTSSSAPGAGGCGRSPLAGSCHPSRDCSESGAQQSQGLPACPSPHAPPCTEPGCPGPSGMGSQAADRRGRGTRSPSTKHCWWSAWGRSGRLGPAAACPW